MILIAFNFFFKMILIALNCKETLLPTLQRLHFRYEIADELGLNSQLSILRILMANLKKSSLNFSIARTVNTHLRLLESASIKELFPEASFSPRTHKLYKWKKNCKK